MCLVAKGFLGLHMPQVCPDGAVVAYAWKRKDSLRDKPVLLLLTGLDLCYFSCSLGLLNDVSLALKAFTYQKRCFFPHLDDGHEMNESASKKQCGSEEIAVDPKEEISFLKTLPDVLKSLEKEVPNLKIFTFERLDWLKRASTLTTSTNESSLEHDYQSSNKLRLGSEGTVAAEKVAVIELLFPSVFRAVISLHPAGSMDPDAVAFFSPDEEYAATALQYFLANQAETCLYCLLHWICSYQTLFKIMQQMFTATCLGSTINFTVTSSTLSLLAVFLLKNSVKRILEGPEF